jgi:hypothetical protein
MSLSFSWSQALVASHDEHLAAELIQIVQEQQKPLNLEEIFSLLYDQRERLPQLMAMTRERTLEMRRIKRNLDQSVYRGFMEASWENGQLYYAARQNPKVMKEPAFQLAMLHDSDRMLLTARPYRFHVAPSFNDKLLGIFCAVAVIVLASILVFLLLG